MGFVKADVAKKYRAEIVKKTTAPKTIDEVYAIISKATILGIDDKKWDKAKKIAVDADRKKNLLIWHEGTKAWLLYITYGTETAYAYDIKADKNNREAAKKAAIDYLNNLAVGKIDANEKAEIARVLNSARERGKKLAAKSKKK